MRVWNASWRFRPRARVQPFTVLLPRGPTGVSTTRTTPASREAALSRWLVIEMPIDLVPRLLTHAVRRVSPTLLDLPAPVAAVGLEVHTELKNV